MGNELHESPRFYNTLTGNCTTKLADHVNAVAPGTIPPSWRLILPGYVDELIQRLDLLDEDEEIAAYAADTGSTTGCGPLNTLEISRSGSGRSSLGESSR